ncbi:MAG: hypothetical protein H6531_06950 [Actinobacteria bacterium]|nr:hypothetical protein [Thermoleophilia bacterium]MCB9011552.1 hypothetical protein [Actinomycetota bacterium]
MKAQTPTRMLLRLFVVSVLVNAVLGIWALLAPGRFGETQGKVLGTSFLVSAAMLSVLVNAPAIRLRVRWPAPAIGAVAGASGFALLTVLVWTEPGGERWYKLMGTLLVAAAALTLVSSLGLLPPLARLRWLPAVADLLIGLLALAIIVALWFDMDTPGYARLIGVLAVLVAAVTLLLPVLSRFSGFRAVSEPAPPGRLAADVRYCPVCGAPIDVGPAAPPASTTCGICGLTFQVTLVSESARRDGDRSRPAAESGH